MTSRLKINDNYYLSTDISNSDIDAFMLYLNDIDIYNNTLLIPHPYTKESAEWYINYCAELKKEIELPMRWHIRDNAGSLIGGIGLQNEYGPNSHKDKIGYWLAKPFWNKGLMTETIKTLTDFIFKNYKLIRIEATIFDQNIASQKVLEKSGFKYEGTLKKVYFKDGKFIDGKLYALVK